MTMAHDLTFLVRSDASMKTGGKLVLSVRPHFGRSVLRSRIPVRTATFQRFSLLNGLFLLPFRIGSVIREQRPAAATTRTTPEREWSSRPRPVNRLQATGEPRRVMRGGSKGYTSWLRRTKTDPTCFTTGKAVAFTKEQIFLSTEGTNSRSEYRPKVDLISN